MNVEVGEAVTGLRACPGSVVSTSPGIVVVVWVSAHVKAVGTVVSGAIVEEIFSVNSPALFLSVRSSERCCVVAPMLGPAACAVLCGGLVCVAFCSGLLVLVGLLVNRVFLIEVLVEEWESETRVALWVSAAVLCGESDASAGRGSFLISVTLVGNS